jgi:hypothetical protein
MIKVIDDFVNINWQEKIRKMMFSSEIPWYYINDVTDGTRSNNNQMISPACSHKFIRDGKIESNWYSILEILRTRMQNETNLSDVFQCRSFLQFPLSHSLVRPDIDKLHIDSPQPHTVLLYYVCDSDGDTIFSDISWDVNTNTVKNLPEISKYNIVQRVTPKQGRAVIFDGLQYHTAEQPKNNMRCVINFNFI